MKTFYKRTLTAVFFVLIMLGGILWNSISFYLLFLVVALLGLFEYFKLIKKIHPKYKEASIAQQIIAGLLIPAGFLIASGTHFSFWGQSALFFGMQLLGFLLMLLLVVSIFSGETSLAIKNLGYSLLGVAYLGIPFSLMIVLYWYADGAGFPLIPLSILVALWINDTMAYVTGALIGKVPFAPRISPKKTWEGTMGGVLFTLIAAGIFSLYNHQFSTGIWIAIGGVVAIFGTIGDLLESVLKRKAGVKDSGNLLPGHGGILDRFDSMILAIPFVWILVQIL